MRANAQASPSIDELAFSRAAYAIWTVVVAPGNNGCASGTKIVWSSVTASTTDPSTVVTPSSAFPVRRTARLNAMVETFQRAVLWTTAVVSTLTRRSSQPNVASTS